MGLSIDISIVVARHAEFTDRSRLARRARELLQPRNACDHGRIAHAADLDGTERDGDATSIYDRVQRRLPPDVSAIPRGDSLGFIVQQVSSKVLQYSFASPLAYAFGLKINRPRTEHRRS
jgi:hypothetical protein